MSSLDNAVALIRAHERMVLACHIAPDGDAIGSLLGLGHTLEQLGKAVALLCDDDLPRKLLFLPGSGRICRAVPDGFAPTLLVALDSSDPERLGSASQSLLNGSLPVLNLDHHITNVNFGTVDLVLPACTSTAEVVVHLIDALGAPIDEVAAVGLLAGIVTDTQVFSTSNVTPATLEAASRLMTVGANLHYVINMAYNRHSLAALQLWGIGLTNMQFENGILWTALSQDARQMAGLTKVSDRGLSSLLLSAEEANLAVVFKEKPDGRVELSLRARPGYDIASVALALGGGGHPLAAGATIDGPLDEAIQRVLTMLREQAQDASNISALPPEG